MKIYRETFGEHCPVCWSGMERVGKVDGRYIYRCPNCEMVTDGRKGNGSDIQLPANKGKI